MRWTVGGFVTFKIKSIEVVCQVGGENSHGRTREGGEEINAVQHLEDEQRAAWSCVLLPVASRRTAAISQHQIAHETV